MVSLWFALWNLFSHMVIRRSHNSIYCNSGSIYGSYIAWILHSEEVKSKAQFWMICKFINGWGTISMCVFECVLSFHLLKRLLLQYHDRVHSFVVCCLHSQGHIPRRLLLIPLLSHEPPRNQSWGCHTINTDKTIILVALTVLFVLYSTYFLMVFKHFYVVLTFC